MSDEEKKIVALEFYKYAGTVRIEANDYEIDNLFGWVHLIRDKKRIASFKKENVKSVFIKE